MRMRFQAHNSANANLYMQEILEGSHSFLETRYIEFHRIAGLAGFDLITMGVFTHMTETEETQRHLDALRYESQHP